MKVIVTGASGFVGTNLCHRLLDKGHHVTGVGTSKSHILQDVDCFQGAVQFGDSSCRSDNSERFDWISADTTVKGDWQEKIRSSDVIINLTGKNIFGYWTKKYKAQIYQSRILTTENIVSALNDGDTISASTPSISESTLPTLTGGRKQLLLNTSAMGYYGDRKDSYLTESDSPGDDFLAKVCMDWENAAIKAQVKGARVILMRFGVVLGKSGGALMKMLPAFKFFAGGPLGRGTHWFPWIHIDDLVSAILFFMEKDKISGPVNLVAPGILRHRDFASALGRVLNRPSFMPAPAFMVKTVMGEMGQAFLSSQRAIPSVLNESGFSYKYGDIRKALEDILC